LPSNFSSAGSLGPAIPTNLSQAISKMQLAVHGSHLAQRMRLPSEMLKTSGCLMTGAFETSTADIVSQQTPFDLQGHG